MSAGKFVGGAITEAVLTLNPFGQAGYERRDRNRKYRKARRKKRRGEVLSPEEEKIMAGEVVKMTLADGTVLGERTEPIIMARTSTKMLGVGGALLATTAAAVIPNWDAINTAMLSACQSEHGPLIGIGMMAAMLSVNFATARMTKSPAVPGKVL